MVTACRRCNRRKRPSNRAASSIWTCLASICEIMIQRQHLFTTRVEVARCGRYQYRRAFISTGSDLGARKERHSAFPFPTSSDPSVLATRSCFLKKGIQEEISKWHFENQPSTVSKNDIPEIVKEAYHLASSLSNVISSWKRSKIYPLILFRRKIWM